MSIVNFGHDENNKYIGGKAGDQTCNEGYVRPWYNRPWLCVLRHPSTKVRELAADISIAAAKNSHIGYDQGQRLTFWYALEKANYKASKITADCEADCSSSTAAFFKAAGYRLNVANLKKININDTTYVMRAHFKALGFEVLTDAKYLTSDKYLVKGDILLNDDHHVAVNVTNGAYACISTTSSKKAYSGTYPTIPAKGCICSGDKSDQVKNLQRFLNWYGNYKLAIDGKCGPLTIQAIRKYQKAVGLTIDGKFGTKSLAKSKTIKK